MTRLAHLRENPSPDKQITPALDPATPVHLVTQPLDRLDIPPVAVSEGPDWITTLSSAVRRHILALLLLVLPISIAGIYYGLLLSDQYVSETRFVIRSTVSSGLGGMNLMSQTQGLARTEDDAHLVNEFLKSRDAVLLLAKENGLRDALARREADIFYGFPSWFAGHTNEALYQHFTDFIDVSYSSSTGITTLKVRAFTPNDAQAVSSALLRHAERVINQLNERAHNDSIQFAKAISTDAEKRVIAAQKSLAEFRNRTSIIDPDRQSDATLEIVESLSKERSTLETALLETRTSTPDSPRIKAIENRIEAISKKISDYNASLAGSSQSMASRKAEYDQLELERQLASKSLGAALSTLENARQDASRQQLYLQRVVQPNLPDRSQYPARLSSMLMVCALCLAFYWIVKSLADVVMDHDT